MLSAHCQPIRDWWDNRQVLDNGEKSRSFTAQELLELQCNFDQCKFPKDEEEVLRPAELLQQYHAQRTALDAKIDTRLQEIERLLGLDHL